MKELIDLEHEYTAWRKTKRHRNDRIPIGLLDKTRTAAQTFGFPLVERATKITRKQLEFCLPTKMVQNCNLEPVKAQPLQFTILLESQR